LDLEESLAFAAAGKVKATIEILPLESITDAFSRLKKGQLNGRVGPRPQRGKVCEGRDGTPRQLI
jgi:D-arabinose 1-dehydrogenase-like Zn-dependent alcohol dehydrogenase